MLRFVISLLLYASCALSSISFAEPNSASLPLMPWPQNLTPTDEALALQSLPTVKFKGAHSDTLDKAIERFTQRLQRQTGLTKSPDAPELTISVARDMSPVNTHTLPEAQEASYELRVHSSGIELTAATTTGALHGLETLLQLAGTHQPVVLPGVHIKDHPRFAWRGLLLDSVRHFFSVATIKRQIDGMAAAKLNVLHWHLTDDQGWRFPSKAYPKLQQKNQDGHYYTREQIKDVITYAQRRGIYVLPEIDMPGHASAIAVAYPELMSAPGPYAQEDRWGVHKPLLNPANPQVYVFANKILTEVAELFPFPYVHIGGDEVDPEHWEQNPQIQQFREQHKLADSQALHTYFNQRLAELLKNLDRHMIGWDEVLHPDLPQGTVVQSWQGPDALGRAINMGYPALLSTGFYLDQPQYASYHHRVHLLPQPLSIETTPNADEPWNTWQFSAPRKRGSAISGTLTVIGKADNPRGYIDFKNKSRQALRDLNLEGQTLSFAVDTWMGPVKAKLTIRDSMIEGHLIAGNAPYSLRGKKIASDSIANSHPPVALTKDIVSAAKQPLLWGGEAALWAEMIDENSIDLRLWPRGFVVAERLWSSAQVRDEQSMYLRLDQITQWAEISAGLQHFAQQQAALKKRYPDASLSDLLVLSSALEPAHYYHRHHEKSAHETYSRRDPLNRLADSLPAENKTLRQFNQWVDAWTKDPADSDLKQRIVGQLKRWQSAANRLTAYSHNKHPELHQLSQHLEQVCAIGLSAVAQISEGETLTPLTTQQTHTLHQAVNIQHEIIIAAAYGVNTLRATP
ncbi:beta-N-acetylhexosaminidase [Gilvimarinus xylanilyticus]|uniref:beta-N-acetylhexosaminidase n=1 Tax=Gilvimarinus xylanilyticus TaxID=2944139 RepID=A0A9X2I081_9GAMM|nr:family 20 glycosylhydrolase [Gilvimarinus xylanilyticus]MCP8901024.1 beta-N-acetylhexosaminidase [Gilvimarinus xylanilyticus]